MNYSQMELRIIGQWRGRTPFMIRQENYSFTIFSINQLGRLVEKKNYIGIALDIETAAYVYIDFIENKQTITYLKALSLEESVEEIVNNSSSFNHLRQTLDQLLKKF